MTSRRALLPADTPPSSPQVAYRRLMSRRESVVFLILCSAGVFLTVRYAYWWFNAEQLPTNYGGATLWIIVLANVGPFVALTILEGLRTLQMVTLWVFAATMRSPVRMPVPAQLRVAVLTTIIPSKEPLSMLEQTLEAMKRIRSPGTFDVWVLDEEDSPEARALCERLGVYHFSRHGIARYNQVPDEVRRRTPFPARTKAGNHNAWRDQHAAQYDVVAQMDPDHVPTEDFLEATLGYFQDADVAYVVAPQVYYRNTESSWVARGADEQNFGFSAVTQRGANFFGMPILIGSNHLVRTSALDSVRGYASHIVEDHLTGMLLLGTNNPATGRRWKGVYTDEIVSHGEGPSRWSSYLSQQMRWAYGLIHIIRHNSGRLLRRMSAKQVLGYVLIQSFYPSVAIIFMIGISLTTLHLLFGVNALGATFRGWLGHWFPQFAISIGTWYWLQRFFLREADKGWGLRSIFATLGASVTYAQALVTAVIGRGLPYVVTPKGEVGTREPLRLFKWHLVSMVLSVAGLTWAITTASGAPTILFWATLNAVFMGLVVGTGIFFPRVLRSRVSWGWFKAASHYHVRVAAPLISGIGALVLVTQLSPSVAAVPHVPDVVIRSVPTAVPAKPVAPALPPVAPGPVPASFLEATSDAVAFGAFELESHLAVDSKIRHEFVDFGPQSIPRLRDIVRSAADHNQVAMLSWGPKIEELPLVSATMLPRIAAGGFDTYIREMARELGASGQPILLRFAHEMDHGANDRHPWAGRPPVEFIAAWRNVHAIFQEEGADNVLFVWSPGGWFVDGVFGSNAWYPGDDVVDVVGFSAYAFWEWEEWDAQRARDHAFRSPTELIKPRYDALAIHGKPMIIAELGIDLHPSQRTEQVRWLEDLVNLIDTDLARLIGVVYFHAEHPYDDFEIDWRLTRTEQRVLAEALEESERIEFQWTAPRRLDGHLSLR